MGRASCTLDGKRFVAKEDGMRSWKTICAIAAVAILASGALVWSLTPHRPRLVTTSFDPPYPETNAGGDPIRVVLEGRIPCATAACPMRKVALVLYETRQENAPATYWLSVVGTHGNDRVVFQGKWEIRHGVKGYPDALVYALDATADGDLRFFWRVNDDIVLPLDERMSPRVGNAGWGYMLSRYDAPYGPRTYTYLQR
jgi:hypothetical protein